MSYRYSKSLNMEEAAIKIILEQYEENRLKDLPKVFEIQQTLTTLHPQLSNLLLMAMVNALFPKEPA